MKTQDQIRLKSHYYLGISLFIAFILMFSGIQNSLAAYGTPTRYEAENSNLSNVTIASSNTGYSGSGYVTGLTSEWSKISVERSYSTVTSVKLDIRYANGTGGPITNLSAWVGSNDKIQDLVFPSTGSWNTWSTISLTFSIQGGYQGINIKSITNVSTSVNIDYFDLSIDDGTVVPSPGSFTQTSPAGGATGISTSPAFNWSASSNAASYALVVSTNSSYTSPVINQTGITGTSYTSVTTLANSTVYYWKVTATNSTASTVATNPGLSFTTTAPLPVCATPTFSPVAGTYTSAQSVVISTVTSGATIYYTQDGSTPTTSSTVYSSPVSVSSTRTIKALAVKSGNTNSAVSAATYTINIPLPAPGAFTQTTPASGATGIPTTPAFSWAASSNAASYTLVVSTNSAYTSPIINQNAITGTSYTPGASLSNNTVYYWKVTATNTTGSTAATNAGLSFTTAAVPVGGTGNVLREYWAGISGTSISSFTSNANYPNNPTSTSLLTQFQSPTNVADDYGQRVKGYVTAPVTGTYKFWIAADDDAELWLSTNTSSSNKVKIASVAGWTSPAEWSKYPSQASANINLVAGTQYYIEALHKEGSGGDNLAVAWQVPGGSQAIIPGSVLSTTISGVTPMPGAFTQTAPASGATGVSITPAFTWAASSDAASYALVVSTNSAFTSPIINQTGITGTSYTSGTSLANNTVYYYKVTATNSAGSTVASNAGISFTTAALPPSTVATPTFSPAAGTYTSTQSVTISSATSGATIYYTADGSTPTIASTLYSAPISVAATQTLKAIAVKSAMTDSNIGTAAYTITAPPPAPGPFTQTAPASAATSVSTTPTFSWAASSNAATYSLVVSTSSSYASPIINQTGLTATSYTTGTTLATNTVYYWKVTATNATGSTVATNAGISFTTTSTVLGGPGFILREYWSGLTGQAVSDLTGSAAFSGPPSGTTYLTSFEAPRNFADLYGQRIKGYLAPPVTGAYTFYIASDNESELWLSTNNQASNKLKIASVSGYNSPQEWTKYASQKSATINLTAGNLYYIEALHKEADQGDNLAVGWQTPGNSNIFVIPGDNLSTYIPSTPSAFSQTTPAGGATNISNTPTFTWAASSGAQTYSLVVSTSASYSSPVINQSGITGTSYTSSVTLPYSTVYYWKVTANNIAGSTVATNAGVSFTTAAATPPVAFNQTAPASGATGVSWTPTFTWGASSNAASYTLVVSTNSGFSSPVINQSGITLTSYTAQSNLAATTVYYWKVTAVNPQGSTVAGNAGLSFTTAAAPPPGSTFYVTIGGNDVSGDGSSENPWRTVAYAASQVTGTNKTINVGPGTFSETQAIVLGLGVSLKGAGESATTITSAAAIPSPGYDESTPDWKLMYHGSLIQLISAGYSGASPYYGDPALMIASSNGNQTISDLTLNGNAKKIKAGVWMLNRNNVVLHHVTFKDFKMRGAVLARSDMWWYVELAAGKWVTGTKVYNCTFINSGSDISQESLGNLCIAGLDGADIYNLNIQESQGYGIKFIYVGHFRNVKIHDCTIAVPEYDPLWSEDICMELWNLDYGNEIYNINCNTWLSIVNHKNIYDDNAANVTNVWIHHVKMIDNDGVSQKEAIECATPNMTVSDCYFKDKGIGMAIWMEGKQNMTIKNNIFYNAVDHSSNWAAGAGIYVPDVVNGLNIYNNVFEYWGTTIHMKGTVTNCNIKNNVFINPITMDVYSPNSSIQFANNIKYTADNIPWKIEGSVSMSNNYIANPGFKNTGNRWDTYYQPTAGSFAVDKGVNVGLPFSGSAPDIGKWEFGLTSNRTETLAAVETSVEGDDAINAYPNPSSTGFLKVTSLNKISAVQVMNVQGKVVVNKTVNNLNDVDIDLSQQPNDVYILRVRHQRGLVTKKVVLVK